MSLYLVVLLPFLGAVLPPVMIRAGRDTCMLVALAVTGFALLALCFHLPVLIEGEVVTARTVWLPQLGLDLNLFLDPLGFFFAALILGIGLLVILYARFYLDRDDPLGKLLGQLLLFQGAMLGIVLSDNILLLLVFWELTSLTSFLLIGYWQEREDARSGAVTALVVTGAGGLALIAGLLILGGIAGSFDLSTILYEGEAIRASPLYLPALLLVLLGAMTKSAQVPFHFWLPRAMAAPTPVSAYLHSATMVKAGVFVLARLWPALAPGDAWFWTVAMVGLATMLWGAWLALHERDLKGLLACSTVSHLGLVVFLLGCGTETAAAAAMLHVLAHCGFKAALFMSAGIVEHAAHSRDLDRLGGLLRAMPLTAAIVFVAAAAMAGLPPTGGFISKELMLEASLHAAPPEGAGPPPWVVPAAATLAALLSVAYAARFSFGIFLGRRRLHGDAAPHDPGPGLWLAPALLAGASLAVGLAPAHLAEPAITAVAMAVTGAAAGMPTEPLHLALWHGWTTALQLSLAAILLGLLLHLAAGRLPRTGLVAAFPNGAGLHDRLVGSATRLATAVSDAVQNDSLPRYLFLVLAAALALGSWGWQAATLEPGNRPLLPVTPVSLALWLLLVVGCGATLMWHHNRLLGLILTSLVGLLVSLAFLHLSAPDLGLTQLGVEVVTTILMLLALNYLPKTTPPERGRLRLALRGLLAAGAGLGVGLALWAVLTRDFVSTVSPYYLATAKPQGGGNNVVNVILVDYRGYDTFGEIIVLGIAALAITALLDTALRGRAGRRLAEWHRPAQAAEAHPLVLVVATRWLLPVALLVAAHILLRGHNEPGGGFVAGLVVGIALLMHYVASGFDWTAQRLRVDQHGLIGAGVGIAGLTGIVAWFAGMPFLTSTHGHLHLPVLGDVELASAMGFDAGVFLTVVGVVVLALAGLARIGKRSEPREEQIGPMDLPLVQGADGRERIVGAPGAGA